MHERYEVEGSFFWVIDRELDIALEGKWDELVEEEEVFGKGVFYRNNGHLHGPSLFYSLEGVLLSESWFFEGRKEGKVRRFYPNGALYAVERWKENLPHGRQEYFYPEGGLKTLLHYEKGKFVQEAKLFWSGGSLKRQTIFSPERKETFYSQEGELVETF